MILVVTGPIGCGKSAVVASLHALGARADVEDAHQQRLALEEIEPRELSLYELESHLQPGAEVFDRGARRGKRSELLREFLQKLRTPPTPKS